MSELMREEFEKAMAEMLTRDTDSTVTAMDLIDCRDGDEYKSHVLSAGWWAWQSSRERLVIELPRHAGLDRMCSDMTMQEIREANRFNLGLDRAATAIHAAGVKTK